MLRIAICDDNQNELKRDVLLTKNYIAKRNLPAVSILTYLSPVDLLEEIDKNGSFDLILIDIYMPGILGTDVIKELRMKMDECPVIFLTSSREHAVEAFSLNAIHYLVKPIEETEYLIAMDKAIKYLDIVEEKYLTISTKEGIRKISLSNILFSETKNHLQQLHLSGGELLVIRKTSEELFDLLKSEKRFYKCGRTYIFNLDHILAMNSDVININQGIDIPMMRRQYKELKKEFLDYHFNN